MSLAVIALPVATPLQLMRIESGVGAVDTRHQIPLTTTGITHVWFLLCGFIKRLKAQRECMEISFKRCENILINYFILLSR
jgi:hypothetical protein